MCKLFHLTSLESCRTYHPHAFLCLLLNGFKLSKIWLYIGSLLTIRLVLIYFYTCGKLGEVAKQWLRATRLNGGM